MFMNCKCISVTFANWWYDWISSSYKEILVHQLLLNLIPQDSLNILISGWHGLHSAIHNNCISFLPIGPWCTLFQWHWRGNYVIVGIGERKQISMPFKCSQSRSAFVVILVGHQTRPILMSTRTTGWCSIAQLSSAHTERLVRSFLLPFMGFFHSTTRTSIQDYNYWTADNRMALKNIIRRVIAYVLIQLLWLLLTWTIPSRVCTDYLLPMSYCGRGQYYFSKEERSEFQSCGGCDLNEDPASSSSTPGIWLPTDWLTA